MDIFNSERASKLRESIKFWNKELLRISELRREIGVHLDLGIAQVADRFEQREKEAPSLFEDGETAKIFSAELRSFRDKSIELMKSSATDTEKVVDEMEKVARGYLAKELAQINLIFDVGEIEVEERRADLVSFLMSTGMSREEAVAKIEEFSRNAKPR